MTRALEEILLAIHAVSIDIHVVTFFVEKKSNDLVIFFFLTHLF